VCTIKCLSWISTTSSFMLTIPSGEHHVHCFQQVSQIDHSSEPLDSFFKSQNSMLEISIIRLCVSHHNHREGKLDSIATQIFQLHYPSADCDSVDEMADIDEPSGDEDHSAEGHHFSFTEEEIQHIEQDLLKFF